MEKWKEYLCWEEIGHKGHSPVGATNEKEAMEDCGVGERFQDR